MESGAGICDLNPVARGTIDPMGRQSPEPPIYLDFNLLMIENKYNLLNNWIFVYLTCLNM